MYKRQAVGDLVGQADGQQHMAGVQAARGAGGAGGGADAFHVEQKQHALALDPLKREVDIVGQPPGRVAVQLDIGAVSYTHL